MILLRKVIINTGDLLGRILPRLFLYKKSSNRSSLTIYNLHSTSEFLFPEYMSLLRKIQKNPEVSQREMAEDLGFSLGKLNYCLKSLKEKGLVKMKNFNSNSNKIGYVYILTPKGIKEKTKLTINFMKKKMKEYDELKKELNE